MEVLVPWTPGPAAMSTLQPHVPAASLRTHLWPLPVSSPAEYPCVGLAGPHMPPALLWKAVCPGKLPCHLCLLPPQRQHPGLQHLFSECCAAGAWLHIEGGHCGQGLCPPGHPRDGHVLSLPRRCFIYAMRTKLRVWLSHEDPISWDFLEDCF